MKKYCILTLALLYFEISSKQTAGSNFIQFNCRKSYSSCFNISDVRVNWETANSTCLTQGGRLFNPLKDVIANRGIPSVIGELYWLELHRLDNGEHFQTTDGIQLEYNDSSYRNYWKYNHPIDSIDCVGYDGENRELLSLECNTSHLANCRIDNNTCDSLVEEYKDLCSSLALSPEMLTEYNLMNISSNCDVKPANFLQLYHNNEGYDLLVTQVSANTTTEITQYGNTIRISKDTFEARKTFVWTLSYTHTEYYTNNTFKVRADIITIYTSNNSSSNLTSIFRSFINNSSTEADKCVLLTSDGYWSTEGVHTNISNQTIKCTTNIQNITTITIGKHSEKDKLIFADVRISLVILLFGISLISLLFLLSSVVIFIVSGKNFFSHDINILHFNNTLSLFLGVISFPLINIPYSFDIACVPISCLIQFLGTNVFVSSLSIAIVVFYSTWIVNINHTARKLSFFLIPIGWGVSLLWALACASYEYIKGYSFDIQCRVPDNLRFQLPWTSLAPVIVIILINTALLILSLGKVWLVLRKHSQKGELKRLYRVVNSGILLIPALGIPFISLIVIQLYEAPEGVDKTENNELAFLIILLINSPIGIVHFILITCQIQETVIRRSCCCRRMTPAQIAHSLHLNIVRPPHPKKKTISTIIENSSVQQIPVDTI